MNLLDNDAVAYHGVEYALPIVALGQPQIAQALSVSVAGSEHGAQPCTVSSTHPLLWTEFAFSALGYSEGTQPLGNLSDRVNAKMCVSWARGNARFYAECDLGCSIVVHATTINVAIATHVNRVAQRSTRVAVTRGGRAHSGGAWSGPVWSSGPVATVVGSAFIAVPPYACAYRLGSHLRGVCQVWEVSRTDPVSELPADGYQLRTAPVLVTSYSEVHPLGTDCNFLRVTTPATWTGTAGEMISAKFLLDL